MPANTLVRDVMTTEVVTFRLDQSVEEAARLLLSEGVDGAPVLDEQGFVVGMLASSDLIVQESQLHLPTVLSIFGATLELPSSQRHFEADLQKALGSSVEEVMQVDPPRCQLDDTVATAATVMHDRKVDRLAVVDADGRLAGIISTGDVLRLIVAGAGGGPSFS